MYRHTRYVLTFPMLKAIQQRAIFGWTTMPFIGWATNSWQAKTVQAFITSACFLTYRKYRCFARATARAYALGWYCSAICLSGANPAAKTPSRIGEKPKARRCFDPFTTRVIRVCSCVVSCLSSTLHAHPRFPQSSCKAFALSSTESGPCFANTARTDLAAWLCPAKSNPGRSSSS